jgi:hypothetical protein
MANTTPLLDHYAILNMTRPASPETLFLAFQFEMLSLGALPVEDVAARFDQASTIFSPFQIFEGGGGCSFLTGCK